MEVNICGIPYKVIEAKYNFETGEFNFGQIDYSNLTITINADMPKELKDEAICHEMVHGIFRHLGYSDLCSNEQLVQAVGNAVYQSFAIKNVGD